MSTAAPITELFPDAIASGQLVHEVKTGHRAGRHALGQSGHLHRPRRLNRGQVLALCAWVAVWTVVPTILLRP